MVQYESGGKIVVLCLACRRVKEAHTAVNIKQWIREILLQYEVADEDILAFTVDSAANIQKAAQLF